MWGTAAIVRAPGGSSDCEGHLGALTWDLQRLCEGTWDLQRRTWGPAPSPLERRRRLVVVVVSSSRVFFEKSEDRSEDC